MADQESLSSWIRDNYNFRHWLKISNFMILWSGLHTNTGVLRSVTVNSLRKYLTRRVSSPLKLFLVLDWLNFSNRIRMFLARVILFILGQQRREAGRVMGSFWVWVERLGNRLLRDHQIKELLNWNRLLCELDHQKKKMQIILSLLKGRHLSSHLRCLLRKSLQVLKSYNNLISLKFQCQKEKETLCCLNQKSHLQVRFGHH